MQHQINHLYRFGGFLLDANERLLMRDGKVVQLSPKVFETLLVLVENSGRVVSKDELMQALWPDTFVEESNLTQNISQIRKALGDGEWIETIPKRGYRFADKVLIETPGNAAGAVPGDGAPALSPHLANGSANGHASLSTQAAHPAHPSAPDGLTVLSPNNLLRLAAILLAGLGIIGVALFLASRRADTQANKVFQQFRMAKLTTSGQALHSAISHDGKYLAVVEGTDDSQSLLVRQVATTSQALIVAPSEAKFLGVVFSPDDSFVYYVARQSGQTSGALYQVPVLGGAPKKMLPDVDSPAAISRDGQYAAFVRKYPAQRETALMRARPDGTEERKLLGRVQPEVVSLQGPAWLPDGSLIACAAGNGTSGESSYQILAVNSEDGSALPIGAETWSDVGQLAWLGDGSALVFNAWRRSSAVYGDPLWMLTFPKGEVRQVTNDLTHYEGASVSADSTAVATRQLARVSRLWIAPASGAGVDGDRATQIQSGFGDNYSDQFGLDWTPDGRLVYASHASGNLDLWISSAGGRQQQLTRDKRADRLPAVSADGRALVFVSDRGGTRAVWRMEVDGSNLKQLTRGNGDASPSLSHDGRWVVYSTWSNDRPTLWKVAIDGGEPTQLVAETSFRPVVSPDGKWIAYFYEDEKEFKSKLAIIPFDGGKPSVIEPVSFPEYGLIRWTPDGRAISYIVTRQGVSNLWRSPIDGGAPARLSHFTADRIFRFAWSRDGKSLACERGLTISDVVLIKPGD